MTAHKEKTGRKNIKIAAWLFLSGGIIRNVHFILHWNFSGLNERPKSATPSRKSQSQQNRVSHTCLRWVSGPNENKIKLGWMKQRMTRFGAVSLPHSWLFCWVINGPGRRQFSPTVCIPLKVQYYKNLPARPSLSTEAKSTLVRTVYITEGLKVCFTTMRKQKSNI